MKTVIEMAREAGFEAKRGYGLRDSAPEDVFAASVNITREIKRFAELVRADEREKCEVVAAQAAREAIVFAMDAEREACAQLAEGWDFVPGGHEFTPQQLTKNLTDTIATRIRARGNT